MYTKGRPRPALAQLTLVKLFLRLSAIGDTTLPAGKIGPWQVGHVYPAGAVFGGKLLAYESRHFQWKTSAK